VPREGMLEAAEYFAALLESQAEHKDGNCGTGCHGLCAGRMEAAELIRETAGEGN